MAIKDYYLALGVSRGESPSGIRSAFRELAKRLHPDRAGQGGTRAFQEIAEAYEVLSDPERREAHNRALDEQAIRIARERRPPVDAAPPEPLDPRDARARQSWAEPLAASPVWPLWAAWLRLSRSGARRFRSYPRL